MTMILHLKLLRTPREVRVRQNRKIYVFDRYGQVGKLIEIILFMIITDRCCLWLLCRLHLDVTWGRLEQWLRDGVVYRGEKN